MDDFKRRTKIRKILYSPITASILLAAMFFGGHATIKMVQKYIETKQDYKIAVSEFEKLRNREKNIEERINALRTERGIEGEIRNKFGFIKKGEEVVVIVEPPFIVEEGESEENRGIHIGNIFESIFNIFR